MGAEKVGDIDQEVEKVRLSYSGAFVDLDAWKKETKVQENQSSPSVKKKRTRS